MSQTSKISPTLRSQILSTLNKLPAGTKVSNQFFMNSTQYQFSLRKVQEATQKLTGEGLLTKSVSHGITYYTPTPENSQTVNTQTQAVGASA